MKTSWFERIRRLYHELPWVETLFGLLVLVTAGWFALSFARDYVAYPQAPRPLTVAEAVATAGQRSHWVTLTDATWHCRSKERDSSGSVIPLSSPDGRQRVIASFNEPVVCEGSVVPDATGTLVRPTAARTSRLRGLFPELRQLPPEAVLQLSVASQPSTALSFSIVLGLVSGLGGYIIVHYWRRYRRLFRGPAPVPAKQSRRTAIAVGLGTLLLALTCVGLCLRAAVELGRERTTWEAGTPAISTHVAGVVRTGNWLVASIRLEVAYVDATGQRHRQLLGYSCLTLAPCAATGRALVRYRTDDPTRFALSWAIEAAAARWLVLGLVVVLCGAFLIVPMALWARRERRAARVLAQPRN